MIPWLKLIGIVHVFHTFTVLLKNFKAEVQTYPRDQSSPTEDICGSIICVYNNVYV